MLLELSFPGLSSSVRGQRGVFPRLLHVIHSSLKSADPRLNRDHLTSWLLSTFMFYWRGYILSVFEFLQSMFLFNPLSDPSTVRCTVRSAEVWVRVMFQFRTETEDLKGWIHKEELKWTWAGPRPWSGLNALPMETSHFSVVQLNGFNCG